MDADSKPMTWDRIMGQYGPAMNADIEPKSVVEMQALETYYACISTCYRDPNSGICDYCGPDKAIIVHLSDGFQAKNRPCKQAVEAITRALLYAAAGRKEQTPS